MRTVLGTVSVIAVASLLAPESSPVLHAASGQQPPPPAQPATPPAAPVAWLISEGPHAIKVLIRDQSTTEDVFRIERRPAGPGAWTLVADIRIRSLTPDTGHELPFTDQPLAENAEYHYRIRAGRTPLTPGVPILWSDSVVLSARTRLDSGPPASQFCYSTAIVECDATFRLSSGLNLAYYRNYPLDQVRLTITRVVLAVHGVSRNARGAYTNLTAAAATADVLSETLIVAPFFDEDDWEGEGWKAGGQFTQRFAATSEIDSQRPGLKYRFVVANPSSYVYLNDQRPNAATLDYSYVGFGTPQRCADYNYYKYGLQGRSGYVGRLTSDAIRAQYMRRYVVYLLGGDDDDLNADDLDHSCEADVQGAHRLARGQFYYRHMMQFYYWNRHRKLVVPGIGHSGSGMFNSANGREAVFF